MKMRDSQDILKFLQDNTNCKFDVNIRQPGTVEFNLSAKKIKYYYMLRIPKVLAKILPVTVVLEKCKIEDA